MISGCEHVLECLAFCSEIWFCSLLLYKRFELFPPKVQNFSSIQVFINQLKEVAPAIQESILKVTEEVKSISGIVPMTKYDGRSMSPSQAQSSGRTAVSTL